ncbi:flagellar export chaperone FliS [Patulibacter defluvii]|uniref:flagellar export chaperone FliS n=1 Tax=Patulibacter defluvii TaxID=3095358 RepID=UPI002A7573A8|nr:flagellar export chaperone FliS [Patulibacter sp. DM4]
MTYAAPQAYRQNAVLTASPVELVVMLYDGAARFLRQAGAALDAGDLAQANARMQRAEAIVSELLVTLDRERGGEVADRLAAIYLFWRRELDAVRRTRDGARLAPIVRQLGELRAAFAQVDR